MKQHESFIQRTLALAQQVVENGNHPFGALLVKEGEVVLTAVSLHQLHLRPSHPERGHCRLFCRGADEDLRAIGFQPIHDYLPHLTLPQRIREFWQWYFNLPDVKRRYGNLNPVPETNLNDHRS